MLLEMRQLTLEHVHNLFPSYLPVWNCDTIGGTRCNIKHVPKSRVLKGLDWLYNKAIKPCPDEIYGDVYLISSDQPFNGRFME